ncbi:hypothetical protein [Jiella marina]|nr:hypothetical protein [Jiella sp. LLJ827]
MHTDVASSAKSGGLETADLILTGTKSIAPAPISTAPGSAEHTIG